ncbi:hypothetical protein ACHAXR_006285 [Thalassiosira sp. AJA248-18]
MTGRKMNVYVHHIQHGAPAPQPPPQPYLNVNGMSIPMPAPPPMYNPYTGYSPQCQYYNQPQQPKQPNIIYIGGKPPEPPPKETIERDPKPEPAPPKQEPPKVEKTEEVKLEDLTPVPVPVVVAPAEETKTAEDNKTDNDTPPEEKKASSEPQAFSKFSIASLCLTAISLMLGTGCILKTYEAHDEREDGMELEIEDEQNTDYLYTRNVALGMGAASTLCFTIATLCSFYAGIRHNNNSLRLGIVKKKSKYCCLAGFAIAGWVLFCLTFIADLTLVLLTLDETNVIKPELVFGACFGSLLSWLLMFAYSEMARRNGSLKGCC